MFSPKTRVVGHGAANVTLGIPRLREIVMTASRKPKTPSMTITVAKGIYADQTDAFARRAFRLTVSQVVHRVTVEEWLTVNNRARRKEFKIDIAFYPEEEYRAEFDVSPAELVQAFATRFPLTLKREIQQELRRLAADLRNQMSELGKGKAVPRGEHSASGAAGDGEDVDADAGEPATRRDDDEESEVGDGDASREKHQRQKQQQSTYESDDDGDTEGDLELPEADLETASALDVGEAVNGELEKKPVKKARFKEVVSEVEQAFLENFPSATAFDFSASRCVIQLEVSGTCLGFCGIDVESNIV